MFYLRGPQSRVIYAHGGYTESLIGQHSKQIQEVHVKRSNRVKPLTSFGRTQVPPPPPTVDPTGVRGAQLVAPGAAGRGDECGVGLDRRDPEFHGALPGTAGAGDVVEEFGRVERPGESNDVVWLFFDLSTEHTEASALGQV